MHALGCYAGSWCRGHLRSFASSLLPVAPHPPIGWVCRVQYCVHTCMAYAVPDESRRLELLSSSGPWSVRALRVPACMYSPCVLAGGLLHCRCCTHAVGGLCTWCPAQSQQCCVGRGCRCECIARWQFSRGGVDPVWF
jgi:hypothetical protein